MKIYNIDINDAIDKDYLAQNGIYSMWAQLTSEVIIGEIKDEQIPLNDIIEARFFSKTKEVHIWKENEYKAILFEKEDTDIEVSSNPTMDELNQVGDHYYVETQLLRERFGKSISFYRYIGKTEDGMAYIKYSALFDHTK